MAVTGNLGLRKPASSDKMVESLEDFNFNADKLDEVIGNLSELDTDANSSLVAAINAMSGADGFSPTVTLTSTLATGMIPATKVIITDKGGDHEFVVKDGKEGAKGGAGVHGDSVAITVSELDGDDAHPNGGYHIVIRKTVYPASGGAATISTEELDLWHGNNGTGDVSMGITGAAVGQYLCVAEVDENGVPTAWEVM